MWPRWITTVGAIVALSAVLAAGGVHWLALQSVAWTRMALDFSRSAGWSVALEKTFDGEHPCRLCVKVKEGRAKEASQRPSMRLPEPFDILVLSGALVVPTSDRSQPRLSIDRLRPRFDRHTRPPIPPPRPGTAPPADV